MRFIQQGLIDGLITMSMFYLQDKEKLLKMTSSNPEGKELYQQWVLQDNRSLLHILEDLPSCKPPLDLVCELLTRLQSRYYSISSSSKVPNLDFWLFTR